MLQVLASFDPHPESVPINALVPVEGTPLGRARADRSARSRADDRDDAHRHAEVPGAALGRPLVAVREAQILCMVAGANSIFYGEKLLTTANVGVNEDDALFAALAAREARAPSAS